MAETGTTAGGGGGSAGGANTYPSKQAIINEMAMKLYANANFGMGGSDAELAQQALRRAKILVGMMSVDTMISK